MLTQSQTIRALSDALEWFEKELGWGVSPASMSHLTGRMGELYVAVMTRGQMATKTMQKGYDVVSAEGERISVKTVTSSAHVAFNKDTLGEVDRVMILRVSVDETEPSLEEILDCHVSELAPLCRDYAGKLVFPVSAKHALAKPLGDLKVVAAAVHGEIEVRQIENGTIVVLEHGVTVAIAKPVLRRIAHEVGVDILNGNGNPKNTRSLGADVIIALQARAGDERLAMTSAHEAMLRKQGLNPESAGKFTWGPGDVTIYESEAEYRAAMLEEEIARTDALLKEVGVDPDNPEATLGNLDDEDESC